MEDSNHIMVYVGAKKADRGSFTFGKGYDIIDDPYLGVEILYDDVGELWLYYKDLFITLDVWRDKILNDLI